VTREDPRIEFEKESHPPSEESAHTGNECDVIVSAELIVCTDSGQRQEVPFFAPEYRFGRCRARFWAATAGVFDVSALPEFVCRTNAGRPRPATAIGHSSHPV